MGCELIAVWVLRFFLIGCNDIEMAIFCNDYWIRIMNLCIKKTQFIILARLNVIIGTKYRYGFDT